jgi:hypothetical protein
MIDKNKIEEEERAKQLTASSFSVNENNASLEDNRS